MAFYQTTQGIKSEESQWNNAKDWEKTTITATEIVLRQQKKKILNLYKESTDWYFVNRVSDLDLPPLSKANACYLTRILLFLQNIIAIKSYSVFWRVV